MDSFKKSYQRYTFIPISVNLLIYSNEEAKEADKLRVEGKEYRVKDGDVMHFRFNV
ncbi:DUF933 domain-containing protein [Flavobacterium suaedae]|uniref:DUF933 domain-containing protein n=1 Tax=Flavobacterium suaedae TaxID=1767027 RepID=UPI001E646010|nr:DUF933 domain-containing protein [Flavobacterium suaedae]